MFFLGVVVVFGGCLVVKHGTFVPFCFTAATFFGVSWWFYCDAYRIVLFLSLFEV